MPTGDIYMQSQHIPRFFVYGPAKSRKTWWALQAAEAGYRVLYFDFEHSGSIVQQIARDAWPRIYMINAHDAATDAYAATFAVTALKKYHFWFNETTRQLGQQPINGAMDIDMTLFDSQTVVVFDSYTALATSTARQYAVENNIDLSDAEKTDWDGYRWQAALLSWILTQAENFPCPLIMIGHATNYEKYGPSPDGNAKKRGALEWIRRQPVSSSNPHGMGISQHFGNVLYFYTEGRTTWIDTRGNQYEDAGSRILPPNRYKWEDLPFAKIMELAGFALPNPPAEPFAFPIYERPQLGGAAPNRVITPGATPVKASLLTTKFSR